MSVASAAEDIEHTRKHLPIFQYKAEIVKNVLENQVLVLVGETGSGKEKRACLLTLFARFCD